MRGRQILVEPRAGGGAAAALVACGLPIADAPALLAVAGWRA
ncbi:hypothetical protein [Amaricoccus sp.]|nr:hypothetical protein [Amaricoccus sp.]